MKFLRLLAVGALLLGGCAGYKLGPVKPKFMADVKTIAVPVFKNETLEPRIEVMITNAIIRQIQQDGTYQVVSSGSADVTLLGKIKEIRRRSVRSVQGNVLATKEFADSIYIEYKMTKADGTNMFEHQRRVVGQTSFFVTGDIQQDERQALPLAAQDAAERLISELSEGW